MTGHAGTPLLDSASRLWLEQLRAEGAVREAAIARLYALLLTEAKYEVHRRAAGLDHPSGRDLEDLAVQAADDALVAILPKLGQFRGDALFTTWARRFAALEVPGEIRRRRGHARDVPADPQSRSSDGAAGDDPQHQSEVSDLARTVGALIAHQLTPHQREVLIALAIEQTPATSLAARLDSTPGALYKTLHDARRKLRQGLAPASSQRPRAPRRASRVGVCGR